MFELYNRLKWIYQKFKVSAWLPVVALVSYTIFGAFLFKHFEMENDQRNRESYRNRTSYAMDQVLERMLEVRCHDQSLRSADKAYQIKHAKEALIWFLEHLNLTEVLSERTEDTPWTWLGSMFYAGQLYTTIGYGYPITQTVAGRVTSIFYILFGIPIFLIILKDIGRLMSRGFRKLYKRLGLSQRKNSQSPSIKGISKYFSISHLSSTKNTANDHKTTGQFELGSKKQNKANARRHAEHAFPIPIALAMLFLWILFSAGLFCLWEREWGYLTSVYFFFVSISTVGLGDIVFLNPDMMIFNFLLILIGLALLSMCFNLIEAALERLLDRLLEEYIEEIEKMAEIAAHEDYMNDEVTPIEFRMAGNLVTLPMQNMTKDAGFMANAKEWVAGRIANDLLMSRLGVRGESDSDSEEERQHHVCEEPPSKVEVSKPHIREPTVREPSSVDSKESSLHEPPRSRRSILTSGRFPFKYSRSQYNTVKTLEKIMPHKDFRSLLFSKFVQSDRLNRLVEETAPQERHMVTTSCQTDELPWTLEHHPNKGVLRSSSVSTSCQVAVDDESLLSAAYCDIFFKYSTDDIPTSWQHSSYSVLKLEDEEPLLMSKTKQPIWYTSSKPSSNVCLPKLSCVHDLPSPLVVNNAAMQRRLSCSTLREASEKVLNIEGLCERTHSMCGLLSTDFDNLSNSSRSTMVDSGYDKSRHDEMHKPVPPISTPDPEQPGTVGHFTGES